VIQLQHTLPILSVHIFVLNLRQTGEICESMCFYFSRNITSEIVKDHELN